MNARNNALIRIGEQIVGGRSQWRSLSPARRVEVREVAYQLQQAGGSYQRAAEFETTNKNGFVYVVTNDAWPGAVKIGRACDPEERCRNYQTGDPYRLYELRYATYFEDCHAAEKALHICLNAHQLEGEWFFVSVETAIDVIKTLDVRLSLNLEVTNA